MKGVLLSVVCVASLLGAEPAVERCRTLQHHGQQTSGGGLFQRASGESRSVFERRRLLRIRPI